VVVTFVTFDTFDRFVIFAVDVVPKNRSGTPPSSSADGPHKTPEQVTPAATAGLEFLELLVRVRVQVRQTRGWVAELGDARRYDALFGDRF